VRLNDGDFRPRKPRRGVSEYVPYVFGGTMLIAAFAFAGHYMGQNASAHNLSQMDTLQPVVAPSTAILTKGSLLPADTSFDIINLRKSDLQQIVATGKADYIAPVPAPGPQAQVIKVVAAAASPEEISGKVTTKLALTPPVPKLEKIFKLKNKDAKDSVKTPEQQKEKQKVIAQRRVRVAEENCLARAIYFEARSESELGQLAVAKVILNRTRDPNYPRTICGVVYQGSDRRNSCQFSFACDGLPDDVKSVEAWNRSKRIAQRALAGDRAVHALSAATNYHADYVKPKWSRSMKRLIKIGRHIFYSDT
jgi:spore germination cell wall hydrolase CwlJ-like protein